MKISEILYKEFKHAPTLSEFVGFIECIGFDNKGSFIDNPIHNDIEFVIKYKNFLKQPIELKMLVPCKDGEVLSKNEFRTEKAKEDVLFSGFRESGKTDVVHVFRNKAISINFYYLNPTDEPNTKPIEYLTGQLITENYFQFLD